VDGTWRTGGVTNRDRGIDGCNDEERGLGTLLRLGEGKVAAPERGIGFEEAERQNADTLRTRPARIKPMTVKIFPPLRVNTPKVVTSAAHPAPMRRSGPKMSVIPNNALGFA